MESGCFVSVYFCPKCRELGPLLSHLNEIDDWNGHSHALYQEQALLVQYPPCRRDIEEHTSIILRGIIFYQQLLELPFQSALIML